MLIDTSTKAGQRIAERLRTDTVAWLTTVRADGQPQTSIVWFLWKDGEILLYSRPNKPKVRNISRNPGVAFALNSNERGGDLLTMTGEARIDERAPAADQRPDYVEKYRDGMERLGMTPETFAVTYSVPIRIRPTTARYW